MHCTKNDFILQNEQVIYIKYINVSQSRGTRRESESDMTHKGTSSGNSMVLFLNS